MIFMPSEISFAVAVTIRMPLSLISSRRASSCRHFVSFPVGVSKRNWSTDILERSISSKKIWRLGYCPLFSILRVWSTILLTGTRKGQPPVGGWIHRKNFSAYFFRAVLRYSAGNNPVLCLKSWANRPALLYPIVLAICIIVKSVDTSSISAWLNLR